MTELNTQPAGSAESVLKVDPEKPLESPESKAAKPASDAPETTDNYEELKRTIAALRADEKKQKQQLKDYERLKAEEDKRIESQMSEVDRLRKQLDDVAKAKADLEMSVMRRDVIAETGLPAVFADRLKGATKDELLADAEALKKSLPQLKQQSQPVTNPGNASLNETDAQRRERLFGKQGNSIFDMENVKQMGGGVVNSK